MEAWEKIKRHWPLIAAGVVALLIVLFLAKSVIFWASFLYGYEQQRELFYQVLGLSDAWATVFARIMQFAAALGWVMFLPFIWRRFTGRNIALASVGFLFIYVAPPLLRATMGGDVCFNQETGAPIKWYVVDRDGIITLYDSPGFDRFGVKKQSVTTDICQAYHDQRRKIVPRRLTEDPRQINFFNANGNPQVWYSRGTDGSFILYDHPGHDPFTNQQLLPADVGVRAQVLAAYEKTLADERKAAADARRHRKAVERRRRHAPTRDAEVERPPGAQPTRIATARPDGAGPSFDCNRAASWSEREVCGNSELARVDMTLAAAYQSLYQTQATDAARMALKRSQRAWLKMRENCETADDPMSCLRTMYRMRLSMFGAKSLKTR